MSVRVEQITVVGEKLYRGEAGANQPREKEFVAAVGGVEPDVPHVLPVQAGNDVVQRQFGQICGRTRRIRQRNVDGICCFIE